MNLQLIKKLCSLEVDKLKNNLTKYLQTKNYKHIIKDNDFIMAEGDIPICLIAHIDTVFNYTPKEFFYDNQKKVLWSPTGAGFDDRAGVYGIIQILEAGFRPSVIFTDGEEKGGIGSCKIISLYSDYPFVECKALIQLDRANKQDAVFYECNNQDFEKYIFKYGFKLDYGTFSDISILAPQWKIAGVNLSIGYINEHSTSELLYCNWCDNTIKKVKNILKNIDDMPSFSYIPYDTKFKYYSFNDSCLICGRPIKNYKEGHLIYNDKNDDFPYMVCNKCFNEYYENLY